MDKPKWGCPLCGSIDVVQHVKLTATRDGKFVPAGDGWEFEPDNDYDQESVDVDDEGEFECGNCNEQFDAPARVRSEGVRLAIRMKGDVFKPNDKGVEEELDDCLSARFEMAYAQPEEATRFFETLRMIVKGVAESSRTPR